LRRQSDTRRDQVAVKARIACRPDDVRQVTPSRWLSAGQVHLQNAERSRFVEDTCPSQRVELIIAPVERQRIGTIGTTERAAMSQFCEKTKGRVHCVGRGHV
jgi:hypothetical protein